MAGWPSVSDDQEEWGCREHRDESPREVEGLTPHVHGEHGRQDHEWESPHAIGNRLRHARIVNVTTMTRITRLTARSPGFLAHDSMACQIPTNGGAKAERLPPTPDTPPIEI